MEGTSSAHANRGVVFWGQYVAEGPSPKSLEIEILSWEEGLGSHG